MAEPERLSEVPACAALPPVAGQLRIRRGAHQIDGKALAALSVQVAQRLASREFATVVFDEAQNLKNAHTQRFLAAKALKAGFRVALSGTPIENHLGELWALFALVYPRLLGDWETFRVRFAMGIETGTDPTAAQELARILEPFLLRRTKAEVETELPSRTEVRVPVVLSTAEWQLYEDTRLAALSNLETPSSVMKDQERRLQVLALLTRLRLVASHPRLHVENSDIASSKLTRLMELIDELRSEGQRALVFSQFTSHLALVRTALDERGIAYVELDGSTARKARTDRVREFQDGSAPIFLLSLKAGGVGLNLTAATNVIHLDFRRWRRDQRAACARMLFWRRGRSGEDGRQCSFSYIPLSLFRVLSRIHVREPIVAAGPDDFGRVVLGARRSCDCRGLEEIVEAHRYVEQEHKKGNVVVSIN